MLEALLVADDFDGYHLLFQMVEAFEGLSKTPAANLVKHFITISKMIFNHDLVVSSLVIVSEVVILRLEPLILVAVSPMK